MKGKLSRLFCLINFFSFKVMAASSSTQRVCGCWCLLCSWIIPCRTRFFIPWYLACQDCACVLRIQRCWNVRFYSLCFMCFFWHSKTAHYAPIKVHVAGILGRTGGEPNSRQGHVPVERANNASANPSPSTALWPHPVACRTLWWERTRGPACSYTQPGIRQPRAPGLSAN